MAETTYLTPTPFDSTGIGIGMAGSIIGAGLSFAAAFNAGKTQKKISQYQADIARINEQRAEYAAQGALYAGNVAAAKSNMRYGQVKSKQRAAMAANGVVLGEGSSGEVLASTDVAKEIDANMIKANAVRTAWGYRDQAVGYKNQALAAESSANGVSSIAAGLNAGIGTLMSSAKFVAGRWTKSHEGGQLDNTWADYSKWGW